MIQLRLYQKEARYQCNTLQNAKRHPCLVMPTGSGKTKTTVKIIEDRIKLNRRVYVITPQIEIFNQWMIDLYNAKLNPGYINSEGVRGSSRMVYVCMPLSLVNILHMVPESIYPDEIITDEAHHSAADSWEKIYNYFPDATRLGLTATPLRTDGKGLDHLYTDIVQTTNRKHLIDNEWSAKPLIIVPEEYHIKVPIKNGDYDPVAQAELLGEPKIIGNVLKKYSEIFSGLPVLVACSTYNHAKKMKESFQNDGWQWDHIHSKLQYHERRSMLKKIANGMLNGLCTVGVGVEGLDIPGLYGLIWLRRTLSLTIYLQFNGRILRPFPGKKYGIILDSVGNTFIHGMPDALRKWELSGKCNNVDPHGDILEKQPQMKICPVCGVINALELTICHFCGTDLTDSNISKKRERKIPVMIDGELVVLQDGESQKLKDRVEKIKAEQNIKIEEKKKREEELICISDNQKKSYIKDNLFKNRRKLFTDTLDNFM